MSEQPKAVVLFSGGLDSSTCLAIARADGFAPHALAVRYGQRHAFELEAAKKVAQAFDIPLRIVDIDLRAIGGSALTADIAVPKDGPLGPDTGIPVTYVPARNTVLLALALGAAEVLGARDIYIGVNAIDYSGYPDCRPEFVSAFEALANLATAASTNGGAKFRIRAPLQHLTKAQIIQRGTELSVPYQLTHSCYDPDIQAAAPADTATPAVCGRRDFGTPASPTRTVYSR